MAANPAFKAVPDILRARASRIGSAWMEDDTNEVPTATRPPLREPSFDYTVASNAYGFYCIPRAYDGRTVPATLRQGQVYEPDTLALMRRKIGQGDVIAGGAFIGDFFPALSEALEPGRFLHSFEPNPVSHAAALYTMALNGLDNVCLHATAVGDQSGRMHLQVRRDGDEEMAARARLVDEAQDGDTIEVPVQRLDDLLPQGRHVSLLQLDIEGHEWPALLGAARIVRDCRPMLIFEAKRPRRQRQFLRELSAHFPECNYRLAGSIERNAIFLPL